MKRFVAIILLILVTALGAQAGGVACDTCEGSGYCHACEGSGVSPVGGGACIICDGSTYCSVCSGSGKF